MEIAGSTNYNFSVTSGSQTNTYHNFIFFPTISCFCRQTSLINCSTCCLTLWSCINKESLPQFGPSLEIFCQWYWKIPWLPLPGHQENVSSLKSDHGYLLLQMQRRLSLHGHHRQHKMTTVALSLKAVLKMLITEPEKRPVTDNYLFIFGIYLVEPHFCHH